MGVMEAVYCMPPMIVRDYSPRWYPGVIWITSFSAGAVAGELRTEASPHQPRKVRP